MAYSDMNDTLGDIETLNMRSTTLDRVVRQIKEQLEDENYTPIAILGKTGIGKTEAIANLASELGVGFIELRLSNYQESDLIGLPYIDNGVTKHAASDLLPPEDDKGQGILLLDEVTSSQKSMRTAVYQLTDSSRKLGQYHLPPRWVIVSCGNGPSDGGDFRGIEPAFTARGFACRIEPDVGVWKAWALRKGIHPTVIAYVSFRPEHLHYMNPEARYDMVACPRNWVKLSTQLYNMEKRTPNGLVMDDDDLEFASAGCVGMVCGTSFSAFYRYNKEVVNPQDIIDGKVDPKTMLRVSDEVLYITAQNLVNLLAKDIKASKVPTDAIVTPECLGRVANVLNWVIDMHGAGVRLDVSTSIISDLCQSVGHDMGMIIVGDEILEACPKFIPFCKEARISFN